MKKILSSSVVFFALTVLSGAQNIIMKDGRTIEGKNVHRTGDSIMSAIQIGASMGEAGYPISQIARIEFPEPPQIKAASQLLLDGKAPEALALIGPAVTAQAGYKDIAGNWWAQAAMVKLSVLSALRQDAQADTLVDEMASFTGDVETMRAGKVRQAARLTNKGDYKTALATLDAIVKESTRPETVADAWVNEGHCHLAQKEFREALLAYLHVPVFYQQQSLLMPTALLGSARAYVGLEDFARAKKSIDDLVAAYPAAPEAEPAKIELKKFERKLKGKTEKKPS